MEWYVKAFIRSSLVWLAIGVTLGLAIAVHPAWIVYRPAHAHLNVVGFLTMLVFGVGYQLLPRLFGHPLRWPRLASAHLVLANLGLAGMVLGFVVAPEVPNAGRWPLAIGGALFAVGALCWVANLWRTFDAADAKQRARAGFVRPSLPTVGE